MKPDPGRTDIVHFDVSEFPYLYVLAYASDPGKKINANN